VRKVPDRGRNHEGANCAASRMIDQTMETTMMGTFDDGFTTGWRSVMGAQSDPPAIPRVSVPADTQEYVYGFKMGVEAANKAKEKSSQG
jgi:hypothetical protein